MKQSIVRITATVWVIGLIFSGMLLSVPPASVPVFLGLACIGVVPLVLGSRRYQIFGIAAVAGSLMLAYWEYEAGLRFHARMELLKLEIQQKSQNTNASEIQPANR